MLQEFRLSKSAKALVAAAGLMVVASAAQAVDLTVYTAVEAEDLKKYA